MMKEFKNFIRDDCILIVDFFDYLESILSEDQEKSVLQRGVFQKYFKSTGEKEVNINEIFLLLIPYFNMKTKDKKQLLKQVLEYLTDSKNIAGRKLNVKKRSKREILYFYYYFHTIFLTKSFIFLLNNRYNFICLNNTENLQKNKKKHNGKNKTETNTDNNYSSSSSDVSIKTPDSKDSKQMQIQATLEDLYSLQFQVFTEENLKKEIDKLFSSQSINEAAFIDINDKEIKSHYGHSNHNKQGDTLEYENSIFYSNQMKLVNKSNSTFRGKSKLEFFSFVELSELRDHFITTYQNTDSSDKNFSKL
jgi:hypothetical protein